LGLASSLVRALHAEGRDRGFRFAALFSDYIDFYRPLGYLQTSRVPLLVAPLTELPWPDGHVAPGGEW
jgi:predicted acetyltransferase